ncbi:DNA starvation/stationary phase protection protein [Actinomyces viscosus]|uniref:Dps family protein n=1 Tax=Actinomyces viscosus TaxID=1656 RepID=UPI0028E5E842|nr:DNA starvation/stationary phase protection protein [Actinomyces viscosus]
MSAETSAETAATPSITFAFTASAALSDNLQRVLVDLIALGIATKQAHWNIVGPNFRDLHLNFDAVVDIAREGSDEVAERMRAINAVPDGRPATVAADSTIPTLPKDEITVSEGVAYIVSAIEAAVATLRGVHDDVDDEDPNTSGIIEDLTAKLEEQAWFISAEDRKPVR